MKLSDIGEFNFIKQFCKPLETSRKVIGRYKKICGIGDDCAVIECTNQQVLVVTTDMLIEGTHFLGNHITPEDLGYKSLAVNLSDIAAMGAQARFAFLSIALPSSTELSWIEAFFHGWQSLAETYSVALLGGDTIKSQSLISISVSILGEANANSIKFRHDAKEGDIICVTDFLGDSAAGLDIILSPSGVYMSNYFINRHYRPRPHLAEGQFLASFSEVHSMMDISDGIESDLQHILEDTNTKYNSSLGAVINVERLPLSSQLKKLTKDCPEKAYNYALGGGEDYCLLFTAEPIHLAEIKKNYAKKFNSEFYEIGTITKERKGSVKYLLNGADFNLEKHGWNNFLA